MSKYVNYIDSDFDSAFCLMIKIPIRSKARIFHSELTTKCKDGATVWF